MTLSPTGVAFTPRDHTGYERGFLSSLDLVWLEVDRNVSPP